MGKDEVTQNDIDEAVVAWQAGGDSMFEFCVKAAAIVGKRVPGETIELGKRIRRKEDTVAHHAKAGLLWWATLQKYPADSELLREALDYKYWMALGILWHKNIMSLEGAKDWLDMAKRKKIAYEDFLKMLPNASKVMDSEWQKTATRTAALLDELCNSPAFGVNDVFYKTGLRVFKIASSLLKGMTMKNIIELLKEEKIADNDFRAAAIANGYRLFELKTDDEKMKRARLYRDWRNSQAFPKSDTASCFAKAIAGEAAPAPLIAEALHSEVKNG